MHSLKLTPFMTFLKRKQLFLSIVLLIKLNVESDFTNGKNSNTPFLGHVFLPLENSGVFSSRIRTGRL